MHVITADIVGHWKSKEVWINGKHITLRGFLQDLKTDEQEHEDNADIIKECKGAQQFSWRYQSRNILLLTRLLLLS